MMQRRSVESNPSDPPSSPGGGGVGRTAAWPGLLENLLDSHAAESQENSLASAPTASSAATLSTLSSSQAHSSQSQEPAAPLPAALLELRNPTQLCCWTNGCYPMPSALPLGTQQRVADAKARIAIQMPAGAKERLLKVARAAGLAGSSADLRLLAVQAGRVLLDEKPDVPAVRKALWLQLPLVEVKQGVVYIYLLATPPSGAQGYGLFASLPLVVLPTTAMCSELEDMFGEMIKEVRAREEAGKDSSSSQGNAPASDVGGSAYRHSISSDSCTSNKSSSGDGAKMIGLLQRSNSAPIVSMYRRAKAASSSGNRSLRSLATDMEPKASSSTADISQSSRSQVLERLRSGSTWGQITEGAAARSASGTVQALEMLRSGSTGGQSTAGTAARSASGSVQVMEQLPEAGMPACQVLGAEGDPGLASITEGPDQARQSASSMFDPVSLSSPFPMAPTQLKNFDPPISPRRRFSLNPDELSQRLTLSCKTNSAPPVGIFGASQQHHDYSTPAVKHPPRLGSASSSSRPAVAEDSLLDPAISADLESLQQPQQHTAGGKMQQKQEDFAPAGPSQEQLPEVKAPGMQNLPAGHGASVAAMLPPSPFSLSQQPTPQITPVPSPPPTYQPEQSGLHIILPAEMSGAQGVQDIDATRLEQEPHIMAALQPTSLASAGEVAGGLPLASHNIFRSAASACNLALSLLSERSPSVRSIAVSHRDGYSTYAGLIAASKRVLIYSSSPDLVASTYASHFGPLCADLGYILEASEVFQAARSASGSLDPAGVLEAQPSLNAGLLKEIIDDMGHLFADQGMRLCTGLLRDAQVKLQIMG